MSNDTIDVYDVHVAACAAADIAYVAACDALADCDDLADFDEFACGVAADALAAACDSSLADSCSARAFTSLINS